MSGIVGIWNLDGAPVDHEVLRVMGGAIAHRGPDGTDVATDSDMALLHHHLWSLPEDPGERQPIAGGTGALLAMDGRLDNRDDLLDELQLPRGSTDAACVLAAYERWGTLGIERLNGEFALAIAEPSKRRVVLARDPIGVRPLYYVHSPHRLLFASEIKALLTHPAVPTRPHDEGLADYLLIGARPLDCQEVTCFDGVVAVVPSHLVIATADRIVSRRYWDFDTGRSLRLASFDEYVEAFRERFAVAVKRRVRSARTVAVSVSGGLDSSSIFCQAETLRRGGQGRCAGVLGISYTGAVGTDADEQAYQQIIEREYGVSIERFAIEPLTGLVDGVDDQVRTVEAPFLDYLWGVTRELQRRASSSGARVLLSGHWGDQVLFSTAYLVDLFNRFAWRQLRQHAGEYPRWFGEGAARVLVRRVPMEIVRHHVPRAVAGPLKWARRRLAGEQRPKQWFADRFLQRALRFADRPATIGDGFHSAHARSIYIEARSKYHVQCLEWNNKIAARHGLDVSFPFFDRDLLAFLMAAPGEMQNLNGVPRALIRAAMRGVLPDALRARRWKADFSQMVNQSVARDAPQIGAALSADSLVVRLGYVDADRLKPAISRLVKGLSSPVCTASWDLSDLYGLERWLQVFWPQS